MMSRIVIEEVDKVLIDNLTRLAACNTVTLGEQLKTLLVQSVPWPDRQDLVRRAEAIAAMTPRSVIQTDSTSLLREDRDR